MTKQTTRHDQIKTFPDFSRLGFHNRKEFEARVADFPPISDLSFATMMMWWNSLDNAAVSLLNDNLVISYWFAGDEKKSGLCLVGTNRIDESLAAIFDYQKLRGEQPKVMHVPEQVIEHIQHPELYLFKGERGFDEYIVPIGNHYPLQKLAQFKRMRIKRFLSRVSGDRIIIRSVDLDDPETQTLFSQSEKSWRKVGTINQLYKVEGEALDYAIKHATLIGLDNICLFIDGKLEGFCLFQWTKDKQYVIIHHARVGIHHPKTFDYMVYAFAEWFSKQGVMYGNLEMDLGIPLLRLVKMALRPVNFFRKYTVEPAKS